MVRLRDYVDHIHDELQTEIDRRFTAAEKLAENAQYALNHRLAGMNEFRGAIADTLAKTTDRGAFDQHVRSAEGRFNGIELRLERIETATRQETMARSRALTVMGIIVSVVVVVAQILIALLLAHHVI